MPIAPIAALLLMAVLWHVTDAFVDISFADTVRFREAFVLLGAMLFPIGAYIFAKGEYNRARARASLDWPATQGEVTVSKYTSRLMGSGMTYKLDFACVYTVAGRSYRTEQVQFGNGHVSSRNLILDLAERYPVGSRPPVYYDPEHPDEAVLERTDEVARNNRGYAWLFFIMPFVAAFIGLLKTGKF